MAIRFVAMSSDVAEAYRAGAADANGQCSERRTADTPGRPCRHCLGFIEPGEDYLLLAYRPFPEPQPYAETGPIFLHARHCQRGGAVGQLPTFLDSPTYLVRGYGPDHRIVSGSGGVIPTAQITQRADNLLASNTVSYVHVRSASNNCYHCRIERA